MDILKKRRKKKLIILASGLIFQVVFYILVNGNTFWNALGSALFVTSIIGLVFYLMDKSYKSYINN